MEEQQDINFDALTEGSELSSPVAPESAKSVAQVLNETLGKQFPDDATALKAVKDTFSWVGRKTSPEIISPTPEPKQEIDTSKFVDRETYVRDMFYERNPEYRTAQKLIDSYVKANGITHQEAVNDEALKSVLDSVKGYNDIQSNKSVLESNPRLGAINDKVKKSREALQAGDDVVAQQEAVSAVMDLM